MAEIPGETQRKLTTIFSADAQDYTRLMGADEVGTLKTLKLYRDRMSRLIEAHGGRVIDTWGDGLIAEFANVAEAVPSYTVRIGEGEEFLRCSVSSPSRWSSSMG